MSEINVLEVLEQIRSLSSKDEIKDLLSKYHPYDLALIFKKLTKEERQKFYVFFEPSFIADVFEYLEEDEVVDYLEEMNLKNVARVLDEMETDDAADVLNEIEDEEVLNDYLEVLPVESRVELDYLTKHEENTAGSLMTTNYIDIDISMDVKDAMRKLVKEADESEIIDPLFVTSDGFLKGILTLKDLILARSPLKIKDLIDESDLIFCNVSDEISLVTKKIKDYDLVAMPIVDQMRLVGIITVDDAIDEAVDELTEDYGKLASISSDIDERTNIFKNMLKRLPWLVFLLILSLLVSNITSMFEEVIMEVTIFAFFQSMIFDMAGNAGTQSLAVTVRSISKHEMDTKKGIRRHLFKELLTTFLTSILLSVITFITCYIYMIVRNTQNVDHFLVALIIAISLLLSLFITGMLGSFVPLFFHKIKVDPAVASGPLITTLSDTVSILIYFGLATLFLGQIIGG